MEEAKLISIQPHLVFPTPAQPQDKGSRVCDVTKGFCDVTTAEALAGAA